MRVPTPADFEAIDQWGLIKNSMAAINEYSEAKAENRQINNRHRSARKEYIENQSDEFVTDPQAYYRELERSIDRTKW